MPNVTSETHRKWWLWPLFPLAAAMNFGYLVLLLLQKLLLLLLLLVPGWENTMAVKDGDEKNNIFRQLLLPAAAAVKQLRKNHLLGGKHRASEGRASSKTTPKKCLTCRLKSWKNNLFRQLLLPAAAAVKQLRKNHLPGGKHRASEGRASSKTTPKKCLTCRLNPRKTTFFDSFCCLRLLASVACGCCSKTASKKSPAGGETPCLWRKS